MKSLILSAIQTLELKQTNSFVFSFRKEIFLENKIASLENTNLVLIEKLFAASEKIGELRKLLSDEENKGHQLIRSREEFRGQNARIAVRNRELKDKVKSLEKSLDFAYAQIEKLCGKQVKNISTQTKKCKNAKKI